MPTGKNTVINFEAMRGRLQSQGLRNKEAHGALIGLGRYAMGWALYEQLTPLGPPTPATPSSSASRR